MSMIVTSNQDEVRILTLKRPERRNALNRELRLELLESLAAAEEEGNVRALVITGVAGTFCAGLDLTELEQLGSSEEKRRDSQALAELFTRLYRLPKPVIAAVNGPAVAGGAGLALACDLIVMSAEAKLAFPEVRIGFVAALVGVFLVRQIGERRARELLLSGRSVAAEEARVLGLVNEVVPAGEALPRALAAAARLTRNAPGSLTSTKELLAAVTGLGFEEGLRLAVEMNALARTTSEFQEGIRAFLEKREPAWQRR